MHSLIVHSMTKTCVLMKQIRSGLIKCWVNGHWDQTTWFSLNIRTQRLEDEKQVKALSLNLNLCLGSAISGNCNTSLWCQVTVSARWHTELLRTRKPCVNTYWGGVLFRHGCHNAGEQSHRPNGPQFRLNTKVAGETPIEKSPCLCDPCVLK